MIIIHNVISLYQALVFTILIEITVATLLKVKNKGDILNITFINIITNSTLNSFLLIINFIFDITIIIWLIVIVSELIVVLVEYKYFQKVLIYNCINKLLFSFIVNCSSFSIGLIITYF
ncbi:MAG: hypothetical protein VZS44_09620 [Bacilli bacterium]|nr:hypothetical protein [Bacilli bacterium]